MRTAFKKVEARQKRRRSIIRIIVIVAIAFTIIFSYASFDKKITGQAQAENMHRACLATSIAAIENSPDIS